MTKSTQRSYLLRLWRDHPAMPVRATLFAVERPNTPLHFADLDELFAFLMAHAYATAPAEDRLGWDGNHCTPDTSC